MNIREKAIEIQIKKDYVRFIISNKDYEEWIKLEVKAEDYETNRIIDITDIVDEYVDGLGIVVVSESMR